MGILIHPKIERKITQRGISQDDIEECFTNIEKGYLLDKREEHKTDPPTQWFVAETNHGRKLKVMFIFLPETKEVVIKSAYEATEEIARIYSKYA